MRNVALICLAACLLTLGAGALAAQPAPAPAKVVTPADVQVALADLFSSPGQTRFTTAAAAAADAATLAPLATLPCIAYGTCRSCSPTTAQPCLVTQCGTQQNFNCGSCTTDCVAPAF